MKPRCQIIDSDGNVIDCSKFRDHFDAIVASEKCVNLSDSDLEKVWISKLKQNFIEVQVFGDRTSITSWIIDDKTMKKLQDYYYEGKLEFSNRNKHYWEGISKSGYSISFTKEEFLSSENLKELLGGERYGNYLRLPFRVEM